MRVVTIIISVLVTALFIFVLWGQLFNYIDPQANNLWWSLPAATIISVVLISFYYANALNKSQIIFRASLVCLLLSLVNIFLGLTIGSKLVVGGEIYFGAIFAVIAIVSFVKSRRDEKKQ